MDTDIKILDLGEAAALSTMGFELIRIEPTHRPRQRAFVFPAKLTKSVLGSEMTADVDALDVAKRYASRDLQLEARAFYENIRTLKSKLHADLDGPKP